MAALVQIINLPLNLSCDLNQNEMFWFKSVRATVDVNLCLIYVLVVVIMFLLSILIFGTILHYFHGACKLIQTVSDVKR